MLLAEAALAARAIFAVLDVPLAGSCAARCHAARYGVAHGRGGSQVGNAAPRRVALRRVALRRVLLRSCANAQVRASFRQLARDTASTGDCNETQKEPDCRGARADGSRWAERCALSARRAGTGSQ